MNTDLSLLRWFFQRISAFLLTIFLTIHIITLHLSLGEIINFQNVVTRIQNSFFWTVFYALFLLSTLWHGLNGTYEIIDDYAPSPSLKRLIMWLCWLFGMLLFAWGLQILLYWRVY